MTKDQTSELLINTEYKHLCLDRERMIAYRDTGGDGPVLLFLHDFASFSYTWLDLLRGIPSENRCILVDLNGFGFSLFPSEHVYTNFDHAELLRDFILKLDLHRLTLVGQGLGGDIALLLACSPEMLPRTDRLVLISCGGLLENIPEYIQTISSLATGHVLRFARSRFLARLMLKYAYADPTRIQEKTLDAYAAMLEHPGRLKSIIHAAEEYKQPDAETMHGLLATFELPVLLIWGENDAIVPPSHIDQYHKILRNSTSIQIPSCGHLPQEEYPVLTANLIRDFIARKNPVLPEQVQPEPIAASKLRLSRLVDRWSIGSVILISILKVLQFFRMLGVRAEAHGWRKVTSIFLRGEYSKFVLASFRLNYAEGQTPESLEAAKEILWKRLYQFLLTKKELHWSVEPGMLSFGRRKVFLCDIVEANVSSDGSIESLVPRLDIRHSQLLNLTEEQIRIALENIIRICNYYKDSPNKKRPQQIQTALKKWANCVKGFSFLSRRNLHLFIERIMTASFLYIEVLPSENLTIRRMKTPDIRIRRHPGWGMICITARLTPDLREADLWFQFHHITADGAPMQEILTELKQTWGTAGEVLYPRQTSPIILFETMDCGEDIFRTRIHIDFTRILLLRKWLNSHYMARMNGSASLAGILMWGLACHEAFRNKKMLLPVDGGENEQGERELGLLFIRPGKFRNESEPLEGFLNFLKEMNIRMNDVRIGRSESHEFLCLCSMLHPIFYHMASLLAPQNLHEVVGSMGLSIIRDAEMFISPLTDFQANGFLSLGSVRMKTEDGLYAGSLCICGRRHPIKNYLQAIRHFFFYFPEELNLPSGWDAQ